MSARHWFVTICILAAVGWTCFYQNEPLGLHMILWGMMFAQLIGHVWLDYRCVKADRMMCEHSEVEAGVLTQYDKDGRLAGLQCLTFTCTKCGWMPVIKQASVTMHNGRQP